MQQPEKGAQLSPPIRTPLTLAFCQSPVFPPPTGCCNHARFHCPSLPMKTHPPLPHPKSPTPLHLAYLGMEEQQASIPSGCEQALAPWQQQQL